MFNHAKVNILLSASFLLTGCDKQENVTQSFETYLERISHVQNTEPPSLKPKIIRQYRKRDLYIEPARYNIGLIDSLQLSKCQLLDLITNRNTLLGRVQDQFRNLEYQVHLLKGLKNCLQLEEIDIAFKNQLTQIYQSKWKELPIHIHNLLYTSKAISSNAYSPYWFDKRKNIAPLELNLLLSRLEVLLQQYKHNTLPIAFSITELQEKIEKNDQLGRLTYSLHNATRYLNLITLQLNNHDHLIRCEKNRNHTQYKVLRKVFNLYFVEQIQPYLAQLNSAYFELSPKLNIFYDLKLKDTELNHPIKNIYLDYKQANLNHSKYWIDLFKRCNEPLI